jgi:hypothetical protein
MWAGGCAQRSGMSVRAARALCIALHNHALCADRAKLGPKGSDRRYGMSRARNAKSVFVHHFLYLIVVRSRSKKGPLPSQIPYPALNFCDVFRIPLEPAVLLENTA